MSTRNSILESLHLAKINESAPAKIANNINAKKFDNLVKVVKSYGYRISQFDAYRFEKSPKLHISIIIEPDNFNDSSMPYITYNDNKFYVHPRLMADLDEKEAQKFIGGMTNGLELCKFMNAEIKHIADYMTADMPSTK